MKDLLLMGCVIAIFGFGYIVMDKLDLLLDRVAKGRDSGEEIFWLTKPTEKRRGLKPVRAGERVRADTKAARRAAELSRLPAVDSPEIL